MLSRTSERGRWALVVGARMPCPGGLDVWWVATYRHGFPFDVDEAGYLSIALDDYFGFQCGGSTAGGKRSRTRRRRRRSSPALTSSSSYFNQA